MKAEYGISKEVAPGDWRKINIILDAAYEGETPEQLMDRAANTVDAWFEQRYSTPIRSQHLIATEIAAFERIADIAIDRTPQSVRDKILEEQMLKEDCLRLPDGTGGLLSWSTLVNSNPALRPAYDKRMKELQGE